jgi:hypothetical protein
MKFGPVFGSSLSPGRYYKLLQPVGPIPAGIYRFEGIDQESLTFSVGSDRSVLFSLARLNHEVLSEVPFSFGRRNRVRTNEFTEHYFANIGRNALNWTSDPHQELGQIDTPTLTFCFIPLEESLLARGPLLEKLFPFESHTDGNHMLIPLQFDA